MLKKLGAATTVGVGGPERVGSPETGLPELDEADLGRGNYALAIDLGTVNIAFGLANLRTGQLAEAGNGGDRRDNWLSYTPITDPGKKWKIVDGTKLSQKIVAKASEVLRTYKLDEQALGAILITGWTNGLVARYKDKSVIICEDPNLSTTLTPDEQFRMGQALGLPDPAAFKVEEASSLMKMLALQKDPDLVKRFFGKEATFDQLYFGTPLGLIAASLSENNNMSFVPWADGYRFTGRKDINQGQLRSLFEFLGVGSRIQIADDLLPTGSRRKNGQEIPYFFINDFAAECGLAAKLWGGKILRDNDVLLATSSVGKWMWKEEPQGGEIQTKKNKNAWYVTQRMLGNANREWLWPLVQDQFPGKIDMDKEVFDYLDQVIGGEQEGETNPFYYFPEDINGDSRGALYIRQGKEGKLTRITWQQAQEYFRGAVDKEAQRFVKDQIIRAINKGLFFGMREKLERVDPGFWEREEARVVVYGGMVHNPNRLRVISECFRGRVACMDVGSAAEAAAAMAAEKLGIEGKKVPIPEIKPIEAMVDRTPEYQKWLMIKKVV
jgi:hypothetical protein